MDRASFQQDEERMETKLGDRQPSVTCRDHSVSFVLCVPMKIRGHKLDRGDALDSHGHPFRPRPGPWSGLGDKPAGVNQTVGSHWSLEIGGHFHAIGTEIP